MKTIKILIVDDNAVDVKFIQRLLHRSAHQSAVTVATNGDEALGLFQAKSLSGCCDQEDWPPDLILLDINMPIMTGFEFLEALKALKLDHPPQKIYLLSSSNAAIDRERSAETQLVSGYLVKPIDRAELDAILASV